MCVHIVANNVCVKTPIHSTPNGMIPLNDIQINFTFTVTPNGCMNDVVFVLFFFFNQKLSRQMMKQSSFVLCLYLRSYLFLKKKQCRFYCCNGKSLYRSIISITNSQSNSAIFLCKHYLQSRKFQGPIHSSTTRYWILWRTVLPKWGNSL